MEYKNYQEIAEYFNKAEISSEDLVTYLYNIHALASYYMYNMHDGIKSRQILEYAKTLAEKYINSRTNIKVDFNELSMDEIFSELQIIKDLPEIYTRIVYTIGRTFIYNGVNPSGGLKYFELAKYIGNKVGIFETYLSDISGILIIEKLQAERYIEENNLAIARHKLQNVIAAYDQLQQDNNTYIVDYKPSLSSQKTIIPSKDLYNLFYCQAITIASYNALIIASEDRIEIIKYLDAICRYLKGNQGQNSIITMSAKVPNKKTAMLNNILGDVMLSLHKLNLNNTQIKEAAGKLLSINTVDNISNLDLAEKLFLQAKALSRSADYTKADAYCGLIKIYQQRLHSRAVTDQEKQKLQQQINELTSKLKISNHNKKANN